MLIIANYKKDKLTYQLTSPPLINGILSEVDETGIELEKGKLVIVRDCQLSNFSGNITESTC